MNLLHSYRAWRWLKKMNRAKPNPYRFGWSYFNKHRGWNWLLGVDK